MATPVAPDDEVSSLRDRGLAAVERALAVFQIGARVSLRLGVGLAMVAAMLLGTTAGEPVAATESFAVSPAGVASHPPSADDHAIPRQWGALGAWELVVEAESRDELEEQADAPPVGILCAAAREFVAATDVVRGTTRHSVSARLGRSLGLGRGPPARV